MRVPKSSRWQRVTALAAGLGFLSLAGPAAAQVQQRVSLTGLQNQIDAQAQAILQLQQQNAALQQLLACISPSSTSTDIYFSGCNVHIVSGAGATDAPLNGLGNLIVGYNEPRADGSDMRNGSHNIVIGKNNNYSVYGGLVAGAGNSVNGIFATVTGGSSNSASGSYASVSGGFNNTASGDHSSVSGGVTNNASAYADSVSGGQGNTASGGPSSVSGGLNNSAISFFDSVSGGTANVATNLYSSVSGGANNTASGAAASVSGGASRSATGADNWAAGSLFQSN